MMRAFASLFLAACALAHGASAHAAQSAPAAPAADPLWQALPAEPYPGKQDDIHFVDERLGFYVNGKGRIYRTRDGGRTWQRVFDRPGTYFRAIAMLDAERGYAGNIGTDYFPGVTDTTPLYATRDGGDTWAPVEGLPATPMKGVCAIDVLHSQFIDAGELRSRAIVHVAGRVGGPAHLLRSLDGGRSWTMIDMTPWVAMIVDVKFFDAMNGIVFAGSDAAIDRSHALIVRTDDGGRTWHRAYVSSRPYELTWKGSFPTREVGYATIQSYDPDTARSQRYVAKTVDGGITWSELPLVDDASVRQFGVGFLDAEHGWVGTNKTGYETRDGGRSWTAANFGRAVNKIRVLPTERGPVAYAIGADVYRYGPPLDGLPTPEASAPPSVDKP